MKKISFRFLGVVATLCLVSLSSCNRNPFSGSKLTSANYDQISLGMERTPISAASRDKD